ncbi:MAG: trehalose-phosphatase [Acidimicrobiales bacterium]
MPDAPSGRSPLDPSLTTGSVPGLVELGRHPEGSGIFVDFDGTLSEIVDDPADAVAAPGALAVLDALATRYARVGVLSGRPVAFIELRISGPAGVPGLSSRLALAGLYGLETIVDGVRRDHPLGGVWREAVDDIAARSEARGPDGMRVESKGLSLTLHYRGRPEREADVRAWAEQQAGRSGLTVRPARMSFELHPPIEVDKGTALLDLVAPEHDGRRQPDLKAVCFLGDDVGDLAAFDGLDRLAEMGLTTVRVAVRSSEGSSELLDRADVVVDGPGGAVALLESLAAG